MGTYNLDEEIATGDPAHVANHMAVNSAVNDLDDRVTTIEEAPGSGPPTWGSISGTLSSQTDLASALGSKVPNTEKGAANGVATLDTSGLVPVGQLPGPTETIRGAARFATLAEAQAGVIDNITISPATLAEILSGMNPGVYALVTGADTSSIPDGSIIGFYDPVGPLVAGVTPQGNASGTTTGNPTLTTLVDIPVGDVLIAALSRATQGGTVAGATISVSAGALATAERASAMRTGVAEVDIVVREVTTLIPAGSTITFVTSGNNTNRWNVAAYSVSNLDPGVLDATSGDDAGGQSSAASFGANGSVTTLSPVTDAATTVPDTFVFGAWAGNASSDWSVQSPATQGVNIETTAGSSDRFLLVGWKQVSSVAAQSITATTGSSGAVCGAVVALAVELA